MGSHPARCRTSNAKSALTEMRDGDAHFARVSACRCTWRARDRCSSRSLVRVHASDDKGRCMRAVVGFGGGETVLSEQPIVVGRCCPESCPGCSRRRLAGGSQHTSGCRWARAEAAPGLSRAREWFRHLCNGISELKPSMRANHSRVVCLLAIAIQAAADLELLEWLLAALRPPHSAGDDAASFGEVLKSTRDFADRFAVVIPEPAGWHEVRRRALGGAATGGRARGRTASSADGPAPCGWAGGLTELLLRLQTNLFYIEADAIGIFPTAWLYEHACRPNARLDCDVDGTLTLVAQSSIGAGEPVTFSYSSLVADGRGGAATDVFERRRHLRRQLGFHCRCAACAEDEVQQGPAAGSR